MHLWCYSGHLLGIEPELLRHRKRRCNLDDKVYNLSGTPDEDSRALIKSLMEEALPTLMGESMPAWQQALMGLSTSEGKSRFCYGLSYALLGPKIVILWNILSMRWRTWCSG